jgi:hypothetical protein
MLLRSKFDDPSAINLNNRVWQDDYTAVRFTRGGDDVALDLSGTGSKKRLPFYFKGWAAASIVPRIPS